MRTFEELRRLAQAATPGPWKACRSHECFEGPYFEIDPEDEADYAARLFTRIEARSGVVAQAHDLFEFDKGDATFIAAANPAAINELLDRLEAAEVAWKESDKACRDLTEKVIPNIHAECAALRAELEALKDQKTVAWLHETRSESDVVTDAVKHVWGRVAVGYLAEYSIPLVIKPTAQGE